ncbi:MAG TPA: heme-binding protein [Streptosporangiaceae bacterium]|nr:heme-binding protein [Streptosporangiaceae bacterium]
MSDLNLEKAFAVPSGFRFREVSNLTAPRTAVTPVAPLGPLTAFTGTFRGSGFNTIFRPDSTATPTPLPVPVSGSDNVLELNLTQETLSFSPSLGDVPNRGTGAQGDILLNGVPYVQAIRDVTVPGQPAGIHFEPGLWLAVPATTDPLVKEATVVRMASIPHGTTIQAQGTSRTFAGPPGIAAVDITPTLTGTTQQVPFPSQTATDDKTARIPQNLSPFITAGTITQAMLTDPNTFLRNHITSQTVTSTTAIEISTDPASPLFGGGTDNIAFLLGNATASAPNAQSLKMEAQFWIETVEFTIDVPIFEPGQPPLIVPAQTGAEGQPVPEFLVNPPIAITAPRSIKVTAPQIQYSQQVFLNFNGLTWPHVSVATLVPSSPIPIPASAWT